MARAPNAFVAPQTHPVQAALWMGGSIVSFTAMAVAARELAGVHDTFEIMLYRSILGLAIVLGLAAALGRLGEIGTTRLGTHVLRNLVHFTGQNLWLYAVTVIPLAQMFALEFTSPLWVIVLAPLFLGERLTLTRAAAAGLGFVGVVIVARPDTGALDAGVLAAALAALCFALVTIMTKALTRGESIISILFWLTLLQFALGLVTAGHDGAIALPDARGAPWLAVVALGGLLAHYSLTRALSLAPASVVVPVDFLRLPLVVMIGYLLYGEAVELAVLFGAVLIVVANWINLRAGRE